jgi:hypothetical protein
MRKCGMWRCNSHQVANFISLRMIMFQATGMWAVTARRLFHVGLLSRLILWMLTPYSFGCSHWGVPRNSSPGNLSGPRRSSQLSTQWFQYRNSSSTGIFSKKWTSHSLYRSYHLLPQTPLSIQLHLSVSMDSITLWCLLHIVI